LLGLHLWRDLRAPDFFLRETDLLLRETDFFLQETDKQTDLELGR
jgi:hypothetical protein